VAAEVVRGVRYFFFVFLLLLPMYFLFLHIPMKANGVHGVSLLCYAMLCCATSAGFNT